MRRPKLGTPATGVGGGRDGGTNLNGDSGSQTTSAKPTGRPWADGTQGHVPELQMLRQLPATCRCGRGAHNCGGIWTPHRSQHTRHKRHIRVAISICTGGAARKKTRNHQVQRFTLSRADLSTAACTITVKGSNPAAASRKYSCTKSGFPPYTTAINFDSDADSRWN
jgi:hypothetical protein